MYCVINESNFHEYIKGGFKTKKEASDFIRELKEFDKRNENPFNDEYIIKKDITKKTKNI